METFSDNKSENYLLHFTWLRFLHSVFSSRFALCSPTLFYVSFVKVNLHTHFIPKLSGLLLEFSCDKQRRRSEFVCLLLLQNHISSLGYENKLRNFKAKLANHASSDKEENWCWLFCCCFVRFQSRQTIMRLKSRLRLERSNSIQQNERTARCIRLSWAFKYVQKPRISHSTAD